MRTRVPADPVPAGSRADADVAGVRAERRHRRWRPGRGPFRGAATLTLALVIALGACDGDVPEAGPGAVTGTVPPKTGTAVPPPADLEESQRKAAELKKRFDVEARRLIDVFRSKVFDPSQDGGLHAAAGTADVTLDGVSAAYEFTFDASKPLDAQAEVKPVRDVSGLGDDARAQAKRFVVLAVRGPYSQVLSHVPPIEWTCSRAADGRTIVVAPAFKTHVGVSYRLDAEGVVALRGDADLKHPRRTEFVWTDWKGKRLLSRSVEDEGKATTEYAYEERETLPLLMRATLTEGLHRFEAKFTWTRVERR